MKIAFTYLTLIIILSSVIECKDFCGSTRLSSKNFPSDRSIGSLSTWMTDLKMSCPLFAQKTIRDVIIPGSHHSGMLNTVQMKDYTNELAALKLSLIDLYKWSQLPEDYKYKQLSKLNVCQKFSVVEELALGNRYFDIRICADKSDPTKVYLCHMFMSDITMESAFLTFKEFLDKNPQEIIIIKLQNDGIGSLMNQALATQEVVDEIILRSGVANKILPREYIQKPVGEYGGIFIFGQNGFKTKYENIIYKTSWDLTKSPFPKTVGDNVYKYFTEEWYKTQEPIVFDVIEGQVIITGNRTTHQKSLENSIRLYNEGKEDPIDPSIIAETDPGNILGQGPLTSSYFLDMIENDYEFIKKQNILLFDGFNSQIGTRVIMLNFKK